MTVNMPVEALNEKCINCPELEIDITTLEMYGTNTVDGKEILGINGYSNTLRCQHVARCRMVMNHQEKEEKKEEKAPAKKTSSRKKQVSK